MEGRSATECGAVLCWGAGDRKDGASEELGRYGEAACGPVTLREDLTGISAGVPCLGLWWKDREGAETHYRLQFHGVDREGDFEGDVAVGD